MKKLSAVMFDFDGTIVDSEISFTEAGVRTLKSMGVGENLAYTEYRKHFSGCRSDAQQIYFEKLFPKLNFSDFQKMSSINLKKVCAENPIKSKPYANEIVNYVKSKGIKVGLVTMSTKTWVEKCCKSAGIDIKQFDFILGGKDCPAKPDPFVFIMAMKDIGLTPDEVLIVEDSNVGALSAINSGATVVVIKDESVLSDEVLLKADYVFEKNCLNRLKELI